MNKHFAIFGLGRFGLSLLTTLLDLNQQVFACDIDQHVVQEASLFAPHVVQMDVSDEVAMSNLDFDMFDVVIIAITDMEASVSATIFALENGASYVIAKAQTALQEHLLTKLGVHKVILPEVEMGIRLGTSLATNNIIDYIELSPDYAIVEIAPLEEWIEKPIRDLRIRNEYHVNIVAMRRKGDVMVNPTPDTIFFDKDIIVVIGKKEDIDNLKLSYVKSKQKK